MIFWFSQLMYTGAWHCKLILYFSCFDRCWDKLIWGEGGWLSKYIFIFLNTNILEISIDVEAIHFGMGGSEPV